MKRKDQDVYRATLTGLRLQAWGINQILQFTCDVEIYQARVSPELWRARPIFRNGSHNWEASSAEELMNIITNDFTGVIQNWRPYAAKGVEIMRPSLLPADKMKPRKAVG